ncbi:ATP-binding protein [Clostridium sp. YIM B02551]|uniref:ATP-binding protein n=1 Tax=Clostridium sp. YIM B02551 TaxID=2910679 RepID=UPI001EEBF4FE|nr:ATP-binding protein [Clostridium sp. YIM B02551]
MYNKEIEKIVYIDRVILEKISLICIYATFIIAILNIIIPNLTRNIIGLIYIVVSFSIMMLTYSTSNIIKSQYFKFFSITFFISAIANIIKLVPTEIIENSFEGNMQFIYFFSDILIALLLTYTPYFVRNSHMKYIKIRYISLIVITLIACFTLSITISNRHLFNIIGNCLAITVFIYAVISFNDFSIKKGMNINYFKIYSYIILVAFIINTIQMVLFKEMILNPAYDLIKLASQIIFYGCIFQKLLNNSYDILFNDLFERNNELNLLNKVILSKNLELESSKNRVFKREDMFKNLFKNLPIPMLMLNLSNGRIIYANSAFLDYFEAKNLKRVINKKLTDLVSFNEAIFSKNGTSVDFSNIYEATLGKGDLKYYLVFQFIQLSEDDSQCLVQIKDRTEVVKIEEIKRNLEQKKIEDKIRGDFLSNISHDIKTPINVIYSATQLEKLLIEKNNIDEVKKYNQLSRDNCLSLIRLTNNLIDSSKLTSHYLKPNMQLGNIVEVIEDQTMNLVEYARAKDVHLIFDTLEEEIYIYMDSEFVERIILNLISNALKFSNRGGAILVSISLIDEEVKIRVVDNGIGMEEEFMNKACNRYERGKNEYGKVGNGIGLYVVKNLTELQGGKITIESKLNVGTTVTLTFKKGN